MSWIENIKKDYTITTGDDVKYTVQWLNATRIREYNVSTFEFKNVSGSLVDRRLPMGMRYDIEIYIQGEDNLIKQADFVASADNPKAWTISHPMYGSIYVQPLNLKFDDSSFNVTKVTGTVIETIGRQRTASNISPIDVIGAQKLNTDAAFAQMATVAIPAMDTADIIAMSDDMTTIEKLQAAFVSVQEDAEKVQDAYNDVNTALDATIRDTFTIVNKAQAFLNLPATFANTITNRINFLVNSYKALKAKVENLSLPDLKTIFEINAASIVSTMCSTTVTGIDADSYPNRGSVISIVETIVDNYNDYIATLDTLQTDNGGELTSYIPDFNSITALTNLVNYTLANLFAIAENAQQQRVYTCEADTNVVLLAYKFYGLLSDDSTITRVINDNMIGRNEMLQINKGREIFYYV